MAGGASSAAGSTANPRPFRLRRASSSDVTGQAICGAPLRAGPTAPRRRLQHCERVVAKHNGQYRATRHRRFEN